MDTVSTEWMGNFGAFDMFKHAVATLSRAPQTREIIVDGMVLEASPNGEIMAYFFDGEVDHHTIVGGHLVLNNEEYAAANLLMTAICYHTQAIETAFAGPMAETMYSTVLKLAADIKSKLGIVTPEDFACGEKLIITF